MESFEDLGLAPELVEALLSEGTETPTDLQRQSIPVLRRGNSAVLRAGPGAGAMVAWGAPLLDRLEPGGGQPRALILVPTRDAAGHLARSLGRLGLGTGHRCAALGGPWALPGHADLVVATPADLDRALRASELKIDQVEALVLHGAAPLLDSPESAAVERILEFLEGRDVQGIVVAEPVSPAVRAFVDARLKRSVFLPAEAAAGAEAQAPVQRGNLRVHVLDGGSPDPQLAAVVARLLDEDVHHVLLYFRSEDRAADAADSLTIRGYLAGGPGDVETPVWLGLDPLEAREQIESSETDPDLVVSVSVDVPSDADVLDRRHGGAARHGVVLAAPRELPHLRRLGREAGYKLEVIHADGDPVADSVGQFRREVEVALAEEDLGAYTMLLEPLVQRWSGTEVAAALAALLRKRPARALGQAAPESTAPIPSAGARPPAWTRLFLSVGSRDGVGPGDILGAITGEAGVEGDQVGRIDIRDTFTRVDVVDSQANRVIQALNGISIRGRSVRADFDRSGGRSDERDADRGGQKGSGGGSRRAGGGGRPPRS